MQFTVRLSIISKFIPFGFGLGPQRSAPAFFSGFCSIILLFMISSLSSFQSIVNSTTHWYCNEKKEDTIKILSLWYVKQRLNSSQFLMYLPLIHLAWCWTCDRKILNKLTVRLYELSIPCPRFEVEHLIHLLSPEWFSKCFAKLFHSRVACINEYSQYSDCPTNTFHFIGVLDLSFSNANAIQHFIMVLCKMVRNVTVRQEKNW